MVDHVILVDSGKGGATRMQSFLNGLAEVPTGTTLILDHNAASPFVTPEEISAVIEAAQEHGAAALSQPAVDTLVQAEDGFYTTALDRSQVRHMQTPQAVRMDVLEGLTLNEHTDLTTALMAQGVPVKVVDASPQNKKLTHATDFPPRTFLGEDSHRFSEDGVLTLAGLSVDNCPAMIANSDGDVVLHAVARALAQAQDQSFSAIADALCEQGITDSREYLKPLLDGVTIQYISLHIEGARPRIDDLPIAKSLAEILKILPSQVSVSAMTGEELTPFGRGEGLRCLCVLGLLG